MTRPRVSPEKRQRTANACDSCKRRKQKCNGLQPCNTCTRRSISCTYGPSENAGSPDDDINPAKRRLTDPEPTSSSPLEYGSFSGPTGVPVGKSPGSQEVTMQGLPTYSPLSVTHPTPPVYMSMPPKFLSGTTLKSLEVPVEPTRVGTSLAVPIGVSAPAAVSDLLSGGSGGNSTTAEEEADMYTSARMLQDPRGRLLYIGDSATLSCLQLIRMLVETLAGPSPFTMDPQRHRIVESTTAPPKLVRSTYLLPDKHTAQILVDAFFINTSGLVQVFNRKSFMNSLDLCYSDPLSVDSSWLCLLHLTFAIGLVLATPLPGTPEAATIHKLRADPIDRAETFYRNAKSLGDPSNGIEDADFWSIQALLLMTIYMLAGSKRNAAYAYFGMAVRTAFGLGLHRSETMAVFTDEEKSTRRNLWRSLYVVDRFLSASLGRPTAISEDDCSEDAFKSDDLTPSQNAPLYTHANMQNTNITGLDASVRSCRVIGVILKQVYSKRRISTKLAQEVADMCRNWSKLLDPSLNWRQFGSAGLTNPSQGVAILHVNLLHCHTVILLTRPFFLYLLHKVHQERVVPGRRHHKVGSKMEKFSEACVVSSCQSIVLVQNAWDAGHLPHRNPFVTYFLFAASIIVLSNEFFKLYDTPSAESCIISAINIMTYCSETDPLATRLLFILTSFRDVVNRQQDTTRLRHIASSISGDPIMSLFTNMNSDTPDPSSSYQSKSTGASASNMSFSGIKSDGAAPISVTRQQSHPTPSTAADNSPEDSAYRNGSVDGEGSLGDGEINFDAFWTIPTSGFAGGGTSADMYDPNSIQGISDSSIPLYGMSEYS